MYNIEKIEKNICLELGHLREELDDDDYQQLIMNNQKLVINFENNEVFTMEKNSYLNPQDERINNIEYFPIPNHSDIDNLLNNEDNSLSRAIEEHYENIIEEQKIDLAQNTTNRKILEILAEENDEDINYKLAGNENTPLEVLKYLRSYDIYDDVLNENYSFKKYKDLMNNENFSKMDSIKQESIIKMFKIIDNKEDISIEQCNIFIKIDYNHLLNKIASYEKTPVEILEKLHNLKPNVVDFDLASNPNCPQNILEELYNLKPNVVDYHLAMNPNCPQNILEELTKNEDIRIREKAINHKNYSPDLLEKLIDLNEFESDFER